MISGVIHHLIGVAQGLPWRESGALAFFGLMVVGIIIEDTVQWVWFDVLSGQNILDTGKREDAPNSRENRSGKWWTKAVGYMWVIIWFSLATPYYVYPSLSRNEGGEKGKVMPFSVVEWVTHGKLLR